jgi:ATP-dependent exoDNAse (exonuclease V) beta subunit
MTARGFTPADSEVREAIRKGIGENMCVEASAGTGKTTVLVDRIVEIVRSGHARIDQLAVITFTEKAAAELASRVREQLERALPDSTAEESARLDAAIRDLNRAHIETIHAFATSLLRERPVEARLDPGFNVLDVLPAQLSFEAAYSEWIGREMANDPPPPELLEALNLGLKFENVREAAERLDSHREALPIGDYEREQVDVAAVVDGIAAAVAELDGIAPYCKDEENVTYTEWRRMRDLLETMEPLRAQPGALTRLIATAPVPNTHSGSANDWAPMKGKAAKEQLTAIRTLLEGARGSLKRNGAAGVARWLEGFVTYHEAARKRAGTANFDDLLIWARDLVRDSAEVRRYFQDKYRCILVDEFQDTDPLQAELIIRLCEEKDSGSDWRRAQPRPGSLFVVGDPKQSIYRFRRADITMYDEVKDGVFGTPKEITQNFRSAAPIIDWVNEVFGSLFVHEAGVQPRYLDLVAHRRGAEDAVAPVTIVRGTVALAGKGAASAIRRVEAEAIASLVRGGVRDAAWSVLDKATGEQRPASWHDIAVLIPSRTELQLFEEALARAGIPYRHEGGRTFFQRQEVRELIAALRAIDDPSDGVAVVAALRSAAFGCSDEELFLFRRSVGRFDFLAARDDTKGAVAEALRTLRKFAELRHKRTLPDLVRAVIDDTRLVESAMLQPQGEQAAANLLKVIDQARAFVEAQAGGLRGFVRWLRENIVREASETDASISEETDDVVRIVTAHASKGLEFPIVVFANMNGARIDMTNVIVNRHPGGPRMQLKLGAKASGFCTPGYDAADAAEAAHRDAEDLRLLYVAATRARDRLVVPFMSAEGARTSTHFSDAPKTLNERLRAAGADAVVGIETIDASELEPIDAELPIWRRDVEPASLTVTKAVIEARNAWIARHDLWIERASEPLRIKTASSLKPEWDRPSTSDDGVRRGSAADFGSAVHALLERIDLREGADVSALAHAVAAEFGLAGREGEIERVAAAALSSEATQRARACLARGGRVLREVPFAVPLPAHKRTAGGVAEGRIDLLFEDDGDAGPGLVIVDWKTDDIAAAEADLRTNTVYRNQALVYAWAVTAATGLPVREVTFVLARPDCESKIAVDEALIAEAETLMYSA